MFISARRIVLFFLALLAIALIPALVCGQSTEITVRWDVEQSGPLILGGWENWKPDAIKDLEISLSSLAAITGQQIAQVSTLPTSTIVSPLYQNTFSVVPPRFGGASAPLPFLALIVSLSPAQWAKFASETGIGMGDMEETQQDLFRACVPTQLSYVKYQIEAGKRKVAGSQSLESIPTNGTRLRLNRAAEVRFKEVGKDGFGFISQDLYAEGAELCVVNTLKWGDSRYDVPVPIPIQGDTDSPIASSLASPLATSRVPTLADGVYSVRDICALISSRLTQPITVDYRLADEKVRLLGANRLSLSDLLTAVLKTTAGVLRRLDSDYILTTTRQGVGTHIAWVHDRASIEITVQEALTVGLPHKLRDLDIFWKATNLEPAFHEIDGSLVEGANQGQNTVSIKINTLPAVIRNIIEERISAWQQSGKQIDTETVRLSNRLVVSWILPNNDCIPYPEFVALPYPGEIYGAAATGAKTTPLSDLKAHKAIHLNLEGVTALASHIPVLKARQIEAVWVDLETDIPAEKVNTIFSALRRAGIKAYSVLPLFRSAVGRNARFRAVNIAGQTVPEYLQSLLGAKGYKQAKQLNTILEAYGGWLDPAAEVVEERLSYLKTLSLDGVVFTDYRVPGYDTAADNPMGEPSGFYLGYSIRNRKEFMEKSSVDPIDLWKRRIIMGWTGAPRFVKEDGSRSHLLDAWRKFLYERNSLQITRAVQALKERSVSVLLPTYGSPLQFDGNRIFVDCSAVKNLAFASDGLSPELVKAFPTYRELEPVLGTEGAVAIADPASISETGVLIDLRGDTPRDIAKWLGSGK